MAIPVMVSLGATAGAFFSVMGQAEAALLRIGDTGKITEAGMSRLGTAMSVGVVGAMGAFVADAVKASMDFEQAMNHLETAANLPKTAVNDFGNALKGMSEDVRTSATDLANSSYYVLSEGYNWQQTAQIMHAAAELGKMDNVNLDDATRALVTTMHDYGASSQEATNYGNGFRQMLAESGTNMQSLAQNMGRVDQISHALGMSFSQTAGALATLTREGMDGAQAETLLSTAMGHLAGDTPKMSKELAGLGINVAQFQQQLAGPGGLVGALTTVQDAIRNHIGPDGLVYLDQAMKESKGNVDQLATALGKAPPGIQSYVAALGDAVGGTRNLAVILGLTGTNFDEFQKNVAGVDNAMKTGGKDLEGWGTYLDSPKAKVEDFKVSMENLKRDMGDAFKGPVLSLVGDLDTLAKFFDRNKWAAQALVDVLVVLSAIALANLSMKIGAAIASMIQFAAGLLGVGSAGTVAAGGVGAFDLALLGTLGLIGLVAAGFIFAGAAIWAFANNWHGVTTKLVEDYSHVYAEYRKIQDGILNYLTSSWNTITSSVGVAMGDIAMEVINGFNTVKNDVAATWDSIVSSIETGIAQAIAAVISFGAQVGSDISGALSSAVGAAESFVGSFFSAGVQLMMGMVSGIESAVSAVASAAGHAAAAAYHAALGFLGIHSPSTLFRDGVGVPMMEGIAVGIQQSQHLVSGAVVSAVDPAKMGINATGSGSFSGSLSYGGRTYQAQGDVHFHLEVNAPIIGTGLQQAAEQLWTEFLRMQQRGTLGISASATIGF